MRNVIKTILSLGMLAMMVFLSGCNETPLPSSSINGSSHGDEQMWQQFQSKQATDQLDKDFQK